MELTITYNNKDYSNYVKDSILIKRVQKNTFKLFAMSYGIISIITALVFTSALFGGLYYAYWGFYLVLAIAFLVVFSGICLLALFLQFVFGGKVIQKQQLGVNATTRIEINQENIIFDNGDTSAVHKWSAVKDLYNKKYNILVFVSDMRAILIPKRIFNSEEEMANCWNYLNECYKNTRTNN